MAYACSYTVHVQYVLLESRKNLIHPLLCNIICMSRVVAKKIVSWIRFSLSRSSFFARDLDQNFPPQSFTKS